MSILTHHMVDEQQLETIEILEMLKRPMRGSKQALEDAALRIYVTTYEAQGAKAAEFAYREFWQNQNRKQ